MNLKSKSFFGASFEMVSFVAHKNVNTTDVVVVDDDDVLAHDSSPVQSLPTLEIPV